MCHWCGVWPCAPGCPNREAPAVGRCVRCAAAFYETDWYVSSPLGPLCEECAREMLLLCRRRAAAGEGGCA